MLPFYISTRLFLYNFIEKIARFTISNMNTVFNIYLSAIIFKCLDNHCTKINHFICVNNDNFFINIFIYYSYCLNSVLECPKLYYTKCFRIIQAKKKENINNLNRFNNLIRNYQIKVYKHYSYFQCFTQYLTKQLSFVF